MVCSDVVWSDVVRSDGVVVIGMRAAVTGASGFVGGWLTSHLATCGDEVVPITADITDAEAVAAEIASARPDAVYHLAGQANVALSWTDPVETFRVNANGTQNLLEAVRRAGSGTAESPRVLVIGSADQYGAVSADDLPIREDHPLRPVNPYAVSKVAAEHLALQAARGYGLDVVAVRAFNHIGPGQSEGYVVSALAKQIAEAERHGTSVISVGNLTARRDFTDVRDVVAAYRLLVQSATAGDVYNVCSGIDVSIDEIARGLVAASTRELRMELDPSRVRPVDTPLLVGDSSRLRNTTGWAPNHTLAETVRDVLQWWRGGVTRS